MRSVRSVARPLNRATSRAFSLVNGPESGHRISLDQRSWDRRPWEKGQLPPEKMSVWYPDRTPKLVGDFVQLGVRWLDKHPDKATPQRLLLIYAWNENGEGGYLTPTAKDGTAYLKAVQRAIMSQETKKPAQ